MKEPLKIGESTAYKQANEIFKKKKILHYEMAYNLCSKYIVITDEDSFKKNFESYLFQQSKDKLKLPHIDKNDWAKLIGLNLSELRKHQENYDSFHVDISSTAKDQDFGIYITTPKQFKIYDQLTAICKILNKEPEFVDLYFNASNQFSNCIIRESGTAEINPRWIANLS